MSIKKIFGSQKKEGEGEHWLSVGDLMAGLMMIFLLIAIVYMRMVVVERDRVRDVVVAWEQTEESLYEDLKKEFKNDLEIWDAELERETLTVRFTEPDVLFRQGNTNIQERFKNILSDFFPRYISIIDTYPICTYDLNDQSRGCIEEVRIEGHTSSEWSESVSSEEAYYLNMDLSQGRTRSVLRYSMNTIDNNEFDWLESVIAAVGFSSARTITDEHGKEDKQLSRRVEFRVKTTVEKQLMRVIMD